MALSRCQRSRIFLVRGRRGLARFLAIAESASVIDLTQKIESRIPPSGGNSQFPLRYGPTLPNKTSVSAFALQRLPTRLLVITLVTRSLDMATPPDSQRRLCGSCDALRGLSSSPFAFGPLVDPEHWAPVVNLVSASRGQSP